MTYLLVSLVFLACAAVVTTVALRRLDRRRRRRVLTASLVGLGVVSVLTAIFDSLMIGVGLVSYAEEHLVGLRIGLAPIEDFAYVLLVAMLLPALWAVLPASRRARARERR